MDQEKVGKAIKIYGVILFTLAIAAFVVAVFMDCSGKPAPKIKPHQLDIQNQGQ